ncbi:hypothetical protein HMPREF1624_04636 [Sporothrix schenckii ATCC 58251]|uniref:Uncharacterized protein n=1 Tax=Sporothrix schenckii (strain ATCC 58251 / de Perez 2211183) TaxID=1391915 RepID=U7PWZ7_SPOS1|nr:hypothetical protein HMPREF1624_04636 [Sporothrix schenckii ATCC 58251]
MSASQPLQVTQPTFINLPQPPSNPDTPSETPGTPTSTTTSLSAVSTTAIKDGHRGGHIPPLLLSGGAVTGSTSSTGSGQRVGHQHNASTNSLEAERADRISRLAGLSGMTTLRPSYAPNRGSVTSGGGGGAGNRFSSGVSSTQTTPTSSGAGGGGGAFMSSGMAVPGPLTPAFFDAQGQPVAITKMSTVGTASATNSVSGRTLGDGDTVDGSTMTEDDDMDDDDIRSMGTNYHYSGSTGHGAVGDTMMMLDDDNLDTASRSAGGYGYEFDRMSDDGTASLVGFGEGAGSTVSGPIYHRRPLPPTTSSAGAMAANNAMTWATTLERTNSGLSDVAVMGSTSGASTTAGTPVTSLPSLGAGLGSGGSGGGNGVSMRREFVRSPLEHFRDMSGGGSSSNLSNNSDSGNAVLSSRDARLIDGMALTAADDDVFVDTTGRGPVTVGGSPANAAMSNSAAAAAAASAPPPLMGSIIQAHPSALRETQRPRSHQQQQQNQYHNHNHNRNHGQNQSLLYGGGMSREHEATEQPLQSVQNAAHEFDDQQAGSSGGGPLGSFDFEERR